MAPEDVKQITAIVTAAEHRITARQDRAIETISGEISAFRAETNERFAAMDRQFAAVHSRQDRSTEMLTLLQGSTTVLNTWADRSDRLASDRLTAQEREIAELKRRLAALEKKAS